MRKTTLFIALCVACISAAAQGLPTLPNPPISDGVNLQDHDVFQKQYILKDKAWKQSLHDFTSKKGMDETKMRVLAGNFKNDYLFSKRKFNEKYMTYDSFGGHRIYCEPAAALVDAMWDFNGQEGMTVDYEGLYESLGMEDYKFFDVSRQTSSEKKSDFVVDNTRKVKRHIRAITNEEQYLLTSLIDIDYRPADLDFLGEQTDPLAPRETGTYTVLCTDLMHSFAMDGYELTFESTNKNIFTVETPTVVTGGDGKAAVTLRGVRDGKAQLKVSVHYHSEPLEMSLDAEKLLDVQVGAETYEYMVDVSENLQGKIDYTVSGRFSVWRDKESVWQCSAETATISWAPGLDSLTNIAHLQTGDINGCIEILFASNIGASFNVTDVLGDFEGAEKEAFRDLMTFIGGGSISAKTSYEPPMLLDLPIKEGTFNFSVECDAKGEFHLDDALDRPGVFLVAPAFTKTMNTAMMASKVERGDLPYLRATATIRKVEEDEEE